MREPFFQERSRRLSCRGRSFCPSSEKKKQLLWAEWLRDAVLAKVAHRHVVVTLPRLLRPLFRRRRELRTELPRRRADPLYLKKLVYLDGQQAVLYRSKMDPLLRRNFEAMDRPGRTVRGSAASIQTASGASVRRPRPKSPRRPRSRPANGARESGHASWPRSTSSILSSVPAAASA